VVQSFFFPQQKRERGGGEKKKKKSENFQNRESSKNFKKKRKKKEQTQQHALRRRERAEDQNALRSLSHSLSLFLLLSLLLFCRVRCLPPPIVYCGGGARLVFWGGLEFEDAPL